VRGGLCGKHKRSYGRSKTSQKRVVTRSEWIRGHFRTSYPRFDSTQIHGGLTLDEEYPIRFTIHSHSHIHLLLLLVHSFVPIPQVFILSSSMRSSLSSRKHSSSIPHSSPFYVQSADDIHKHTQTFVLYAKTQCVFTDRWRW